MMGGPHIMIVKNPADGMGKNENDAPAGYITSGADTINKLFSYDRKKQLEAGERWEKVQEPGGADYLKANFPDLDYILFAQVITTLPRIPALVREGTHPGTTARPLTHT
jgi:hypothetical protein